MLAREAQTAIQGGFAIDFVIILPFVALFAVALAAQIVIVKLVKEGGDKKHYRRHGAITMACVAVIVGVASLITTFVQISGLSQDNERNIFGISVRENFDSFQFKIPFFRSFGTFALAYRNVFTNTQASSGIVYQRDWDETRDYFAGEAQRADKFCYYQHGETQSPDNKGYTTSCNDQSHLSPDEGNNLLVILLESFEDFMIHPKFTPAIYGLQQRSIVFDNFYGHNKTDVSEASVIFGSYPMTMGIVPAWNQVSGNHSGDTRNPNFTQSFPFSMPSVLGEQGYGARNYFHDSSASHYSRSYTHPAYGFEEAYFLEDFPIGPKYDTTTRWRSDWVWNVPEREFFEHAVDLILPEKQEDPFFSFITTINAHGTYGLRENLPEIYNESFDFLTEHEDEYLEEYKSLLTPSQFINFKVAMAKAMVADNGIAYLLEQLEARDGMADGATMADETTILVFADHNAYGNNLSFNVKQSGRNTSPAHKIPAFLYSPQLAKHGLKKQPLVVNKFMMHFDLVPTVFDILGIEYNPRMYLGFHAFDERENVIISRLGPVFNDKYLTDGMGVLWAYTKETPEDLVAFRENYLDLNSRWSYVHNLYSLAFQSWSNTDSGSSLI